MFSENEFERYTNFSTCNKFYLGTVSPFVSMDIIELLDDVLDFLDAVSSPSELPVVVNRVPLAFVRDGERFVDYETNNHSVEELPHVEEEVKYAVELEKFYYSKFLHVTFSDHCMRQQKENFLFTNFYKGHSKQRGRGPRGTGANISQWRNRKTWVRNRTLYKILRASYSLSDMSRMLALFTEM